MGAFPIDDLTTINLDDAGDDPSQARAELLAAVLKLKAVIASYNDVNGLCPLDADSKISTNNIDATILTAALNVATTSLKGLMSAADKTKLNGIETNANNYSLPTATSGTLGGIKVGGGLSIASGVLSADSQINEHAAGSYVMQVYPPGPGVAGWTTAGYAEISDHGETERCEWKIARAGVIRVRMGCRTGSIGNVSAKIRVLKNNVSVYQLTVTNTTWAYYNADIAVDNSDQIQIKTTYLSSSTSSGRFWAAIMTNIPSDAGSLYTYLDEFA